ncbi:polymorphic toxin-type HINT domain-containing protein [Micromonospora sp. NBC_00858]|nr:polymorphic toxin-type HINT domain-containing protein [Micromonospora sp. NBC_00858]
MLTVPAQAAVPTSGYSKPSAKPVPTVPVNAVKTNQIPEIKRLPSASDRPAPNWPSAGSEVVDLTDTRGLDQAKQAGSLPVRIKASAATAKGQAPSPGRVRVEVLDRAATVRAQVQGVLLRAERTDGIASAGPTDVTVDYRPFENAYGADWASRLRLVAVPSCALTAPHKSECAPTPLPSRNDLAARSVSATVPVGPTATLFAVSAASSGPTGDYAATSLQSSSTWSAGGNTGAFTWSYPMRTPPPPGGTAPVVALSYSSQSVDGRHAATNNQPSWVGEGFETVAGGFIERRYRPCARDMDDDGRNNTRKTGDLCWETDNATLSLNGNSGELIYNAAEDKWHLRNDDGSRITRQKGADNDDDDGEHWVLTTTDGVQYWFGRNHLPGWVTGKPETNSTWTAPVFGNDSNEPCQATAFADSDCMQAWRWNLDYVVDPSGNSISYWYKKEANKYSRNLDPDDDAGYDRGGWLDRIDYGTRQSGGVDSVLTTAAPYRIDFAEGDRCLDSCTVHDGVHWPDTPWESECTGSSCGDKYTPTFWSTKRLLSVTTQVRSGGSYNNVEQWNFTHRFPDPGDTTRAGLWLDKISHRGLVGTTTTVPDIEFTEVQLANRVDTEDFAAAMNWLRITRIRNETGGTTSINYSKQDCSATGPKPTPHANASRCYPVIWEPEGYSNPVTDWFNKYVVETIYENDNTGGVPPQGSPRIVYKYDYLDGAAWHYSDDDGLIDKKYKTWSDYRGYGRVSVTVGDPGEQTYTETRYFRGLYGDRASTTAGDLRTTKVDGINDEDWFAGMTRETTVFNRPGGPVVSREESVPWSSSATASRKINGDTVTSRFTRVGTVQKFSSLDAGRGERSTTTTTSYDEYGMAVRIEDSGRDGVAGDERCTKNDYTPRNTGKWLVDRVHRVQQYAVACGAADDTAELADADVMTEVRTFYDNATGFETAPTRGLVTRTEEMSAWNGGQPTFAVKGRAAYDAHGRATSVWDPMNFETKTSFTPVTGGPVTATKVTNPMLHETSTTLAPAWGLATAVVDPNLKRTDLAYDGLGRLVAVWLPGRDSTKVTANVTFEYQLNTAAATAVTTSRLNAAGSYIKTYELYDGLLRTRQTQATSPSGGRVLTDTFYDTVGREIKTFSPYHVTGAAGTSLDTATERQFVPSQQRKQYDGAGRITATIFQPYDVERWRNSTYYAGDRIDTTPPAGGTATSAVVDVQGRTSELRQYHGAIPTPAAAGSWDALSYRFNRKGQLDSVTDADNNQWTYAYDIRGRQIETTDPDKGKVNSTYDNSGRVTTTDAGGKKLAYQYDSLNRKVGVYENQLSGTQRAQWRYDTLAKGKLTQSTRMVGTATYQTIVMGYTDTYQPTGTQVIIPASETGLAGTYNFDNTWNAADGSLASSSLPSTNSDLPAETLFYAYDALGLPTTLKTLYGNLSSSYVTRTDYNALGLVDQIELYAGAGGRVKQAFTRELETGRLTGIRTDRDSSSPNILADVSYAFDPSGNITMIKDVAPDPVDDTQCFTYDQLRRLRHAWTPESGVCGTPDADHLAGPAPYWHEWTYDKVGNRREQIVHTASGASTTTYNYPAPGTAQAHTLTSTSGAVNGAYTYDEVGNTKTRPSATGTQRLTWDSEGHLETSTDDSGETRYIYDAEGNRLIRRDPTGRTLYLPGQEIRYTTATKATTCTRYYSYGGALVASRTATALTWLTSDPQGTAQVAVTAISQGTTVRRQFPFGAPRGDDAPWANDKGFVGGTRDNTGLTHLGAREYDPQLGRFISVDPIMDLTDPQQIHGYTYANNSPITLSDPDGLDPGGGQACDNGLCTPNSTWGQTGGGSSGTGSGSGNGSGSNGGGSGNGGGSSGSTATADRDIRERAERNKQLFVQTFNDDNSFCQAPGYKSRCDEARNAVAGGYDPYNAWVELVCGNGWGNTICMNELGYKWNCGATACPDVLTHGGEILAGVTGGVEVMGGRGALGGFRSAATDSAILARLSKLAGQNAGGKLEAANSLGYRLANGFCSFSGDTRVLMADGTTKPISEIELGDEVLATDPETGEEGPREVTRLWVHDDDVVALAVNDGVLTTTEDHPFWNETDREWQRVDALDPGDALLSAGGRHLAVDEMIDLAERQTVYNLTVAAIHTYYVMAGATPVLVHNASCGPLTAAQQTDIAKYLGYNKLRGNYGKANVFEIKKPGPGQPRYISRDIDQHNGGVFKGANKIEDLWSKSKRTGTYDVDIVDGEVRGLRWIGE